MGGIIWYIALHYGPSELFASAISGPSSDVTMLIHCKVHKTLVDDYVSNKDICLFDLWKKMRIGQENGVQSQRDGLLLIYKRLPGALHLPFLHTSSGKWLCIGVP
jgi:hypothetical protein